MKKAEMIIFFCFLSSALLGIAYKFGIKFAVILVLITLILLIFLLRPKFSLYFFLFMGVFYTPLYEYKFRLFGILFLPTDLMAILIYLLVLINLFAGRYINLKRQNLNLGKVPVEGKLHYVILFLILLSTLIGLAQGNYWKSIFRETKLALYYGLIPLFSTYLISKASDIKRYFAILILLATIGSIYDLYCRIFDIYTVSAFAGSREGVITYAETPIGRIIRDYGWVSTFHYQVIAFLACLIFFFATKKLSLRILLLIAGSINLVANLLTVTRGFTLAILAGVIFMVFLRGLSESTSVFKAFRRLAVSLVVIFAVFYVAISFVPETKASFYRFISIFSPTYAGRGDIENMQVRLLSIYLGLTTGIKNPFGRGFGILSPTGEETSSEAMTLWLLYHNSIGYIFFTFGVVGGVLLFYLFVKLILRLLRLFRFTTKEGKHILALILVSFIAVFSMSFTSGNFLFAIENLLPFIVTLFSFSLKFAKYRENKAWETNH